MSVKSMNTTSKYKVRTASDTARMLMDRAIELAITEDLGAAVQDPTTDAIVAPSVHANGAIYAKEAGVIVGLDVVELVMKRFDDRIEVTSLVEPGAFIKNVPTKIATFSGPAGAILKAERLALNLLQRMSGIATVTWRFVEMTKGTKIEILDTRKTTPGLRAFERLAVAAAGGVNHRFGLYDAILIKDNHVRLAGGIRNAVEAARRSNSQLSIEVETTTLEEVAEAVDCRAERIMLDNMSPQQIQDAVALIKGRAYIEVSGGVKLSTIDGYLIEGVNGISIGALTHSAPGLDISLEVETFI
jgi:nicotinate-nucleotide pyrophosphorylase (carboxylating)